MVGHYFVVRTSTTLVSNASTYFQFLSKQTGFQKRMSLGSVASPLSVRSRRGTGIGNAFR